MTGDTIFAVASGGGRAAIAVIRLSGPGAAEAVRGLAGGLPPPRRAVLRRLRDARSDRDLDSALVLWFPGPGSFTGEDGAEFHIHGGRAVVDAVLAVLAACAGCRLAEPGEFTRRAFLNGKMDLAEVEGLADLIDAQTESQRRQALRQLDGALGRWVALQRALLVRALAAAESAIDFADESDVAGDFGAEVQHYLAALARAVDDELLRAEVGARIRDGLVVVLAGPPNVGKSTLLNALARRDIAIVSPHAGTTRDAIEVEVDLGGCLVTFIDTAGLRESDDPVEREGIARAKTRAAAADLVLWLSEASAPAPPDPAMRATALWRVVTKIDLAPAQPPEIDHAIAAPTGQGIDGLIQAVRHLVAQDEGAAGSGVTTRLRHRRALQEAQDALRAIKVNGPLAPLEIVVEQIRFVADRLDRLVGRIEPDEVLGEIFARFCIGK